MHIRIQYTDGTTVELQHVQTIQLVAVGSIMLNGSEFMIQTFGNDAVRHVRVLNLDILGW